MKRPSFAITAVLAILLLAACASQQPTSRQRQVSSLLAFLYPGSEEHPKASDRVAEIPVPLRLGIVFVPDQAGSGAMDPQARLPEAERLALASKVRDAFKDHPFLSDIQTVPSSYLEPGGGFANLRRIGAMLNLDVVALISYDQVQNSGANGWSFLYWTGIGAYAVDGDQYDVFTAVDTAVFDIRSERLLLRAGGTSRNRGSASFVSFSKEAREARSQGFDSAVAAMIAKLQVELEAFRARAEKDPSIKLVISPNYRPAPAAK